jgi:hypothetical protein
MFILNEHPEEDTGIENELTPDLQDKIKRIIDRLLQSSVVLAGPVLPQTDPMDQDDTG